MVRSTLALAAVLSFASISLARDLFTPPAYVGGDQEVTCKMLNITSAPIPAELEMIQEGGTVLYDSGPITLGPSLVWGYSHAGPNDIVYCRFVNATTRKIRADLTVYIPVYPATDTTVVPAQ